MDEKKALINSKMQLIDLFSKDAMLPSDLTVKISKKIKIHFETLTLDDNERAAIISDLPKSLRYDIGMSMFQGAAQKIKFFKDKEVAFLADIVPRLKHTVIDAKQFLYRKGDYADEIYFLVEGRVGFVYGRNNIVFKNMISGSYFGEIEIIDQTPRDCSIITEAKTELLILTKNIVDIMLVEYPRVAVELKHVADERKKRNNAAKQEIIDLLETVELKKESTFSSLAGQQKIEKKLDRKRSITPSAFDNTEKGLSPSLSNEGDSEYMSMRLQMKSLEEKLEGLDTKLSKIIGIIEKEKRSRPTSPVSKRVYLPPIHPNFAVIRNHHRKDTHV